MHGEKEEEMRSFRCNDVSKSNQAPNRATWSETIYVTQLVLRHRSIQQSFSVWDRDDRIVSMNGISLLGKIKEESLNLFRKYAIYGRKKCCG